MYVPTLSGKRPDKGDVVLVSVATLPDGASVIAQAYVNDSSRRHEPIVSASVTEDDNDTVEPSVGEDGLTAMLVTEGTLPPHDATFTDTVFGAPVSPRASVPRTSTT